ncbi:MAG: hypothetical protein GEU68_14135 [Actinobacteria bacterium]|nr:hypothetical protein [Actinomycetota bacterium]
MEIFNSLVGPFQAAWDRRVSIAYRGSAQLCDFDHVPIWFEGTDPATRKQPLHVDVKLELWSRSRRVSLLPDEAEGEIDGLQLLQGSKMFSKRFPGATLEPDSAPIEVLFYLQSSDPQLLRQQVGKQIKIRFRTTRRSRRPRIRLRLDELKS